MAGITQWLMNPIGNLLNLFNTSNDGNGTIWNHDNGYETNSFTEEGNKNAGNFGIDPNGYVSGIWNDLMGFTSQSREFSQQEYLQDKMNEYNSPENQMARMRAAGINPNVAAAGIAGGGNESAQAPAVNSNQNGVANGIGQAAGAIASLGAGAAGLAGAKEVMTLLGDKQSLLQAQAIHELESAGLDHWNSVSIATLLPTMSANQQADFYLKLAQYDNIRAEYQVILDEHNLKLEQIRYQGNLADEEAEKVRFAKAETDFFIAHGYRDDSPLDVSLRNSVVTGRKDEAAKIGGSIESYNYNAAKGAFSADADTAYKRAYNRMQGEAAGNADNAKYLNDLETYKESYLRFLDTMYKLPTNIRESIIYSIFQSRDAVLCTLLEEAGFKKPKYHDATESKKSDLGGEYHPNKGSFRW